MAEKGKLLLVEDEPNLGSVLSNYLKLSGYEVVWAKNGQEGLKHFDPELVDLCLLDVMMPEMDGFTLAREIRKTSPDVPVLFITAKSMKEDILEGYQIGADDYITKPFDTEVLLAKIEAFLRRKGMGKEPEHCQIGIYRYTPKFRELHGPEGNQVLSPKEGALLGLFCQHINDILTREKALRTIWGDDNYFTTRSMDVYITKLRKYLRADPNIEIINIHSNGYMLKIH
ncbi:response regulator transcription factor [bacterium SCSIO 12741]|nr:response regulator transcription factor [bacterium SCSIO 12741]